MRREKDEFDTLHWVIVLCTAAALIAGLIEFNARRQAAAMTRELLRPATAEEQARIKAMTDQLDAEGEATLKQLWAQSTQPANSQRYDPRPLSEGERCMQHKRLRRIENGWEEIGTCR